jgi:hypothetical protein
MRSHRQAVQESYDFVRTKTMQTGQHPPDYVQYEDEPAAGFNRDPSTAQNFGSSGNANSFGVSRPRSKRNPLLLRIR